MKVLFKLYVIIIIVLYYICIDWILVLIFLLEKFGFFILGFIWFYLIVIGKIWIFLYLCLFGFILL